MTIRRFLALDTVLGPRHGIEPLGLDVLFHGYVGTTSMGGARAAKKSDWESLAGRDPVIWPDHDEPGRQYAEDVAALAMRGGAASVRIVDIPKDWPDGWDLADPLPDGVGMETGNQAIDK